MGLVTISGRLVGASVLLPRCPGDKQALLLKLRDAASEQTLEVVSADTAEIRDILSLAGEADAAGPKVTLAVQARLFSLSGLTNGTVKGNAYRLLVVGVEAADGSPPLRSEAAAGDKQAAELLKGRGDDGLVPEKRERPR